MKNKTYIHKVIINDNLMVEMKIPEELDVVTFNSIFAQAKKIVSAGQVTIETEKPLVTIEREPTKRKWGQSPEEEEQMLEDYEATKDRPEKLALAKRYGYTFSTVQTKVKDIRRRLGLSKKKVDSEQTARKKSPNYKRGSYKKGIFNSDKDKIIKLANEGKTRTDIAKILKFDYDKKLLKRLSDYMYKLRLQGFVKGGGHG